MLPSLTAWATTRDAPNLCLRRARAAPLLEWMNTPVAPSGEERARKAQLFALSFTALFLELMVIRWVPSVELLIAYYANLMLLSSFLGLGLGALAGSRRWPLFDWFPAFLAADVAVIILCRHVALGGSAVEMRFSAPPPAFLSRAVLVGIFGANALLFLPLGQRIGQLFDSLPRLAAYGWDLAGSLCGTLTFGLFSFKLFSPLLGLGIVALLYLIVCRGRRWVLSVPLFAAVLGLLFATQEPAAQWSPYYYIYVTKVALPVEPARAPPPDLRTMRDPPVYAVRVNQFGYHYDATLDLSRYTPGTPQAWHIGTLWDQYRVPYLLCPGRDRVLVVGAGGGVDVQAGLLSGARHIDAVEIDPVIAQVSRRFNAADPYADPRVTVHIDDARSFFAHATPGYDLVIFGFLDSQALFSAMSNVRLDGFVYTVESLRSAYALVREGGVLSLSFYASRDWLVPKLYRMLADATGQTPRLYLNDRNLILTVAKGYTPPPLPAGYKYQQLVFDTPPAIERATDDWPYLYLSRRTIPADYLIAIGGLLALSVAAIAGFKPAGTGRPGWFFGCLGMGFLLLETKSISDCTLFFGATWFVTLVVVAGVLLMVLAANFVATRLRGFSYWLYLPLFAALLLLYAVPRQQILHLDLGGRLLWTLAAVPLPVFFAGLIFSTSFREAATPSALFGANLIGAMIGGFSEYLGMVMGTHQLALLIIGAYLASLGLAAFARRAGPAAAATGAPAG